VRASRTGVGGNDPSLFAAASWSIIEVPSGALQEGGGGCDDLAVLCNLPASAKLIHLSARKFREDAGHRRSARRGRHEERIEVHAQDDGFPAQEDPSKTASGACSTAAREKGSTARTKERDDLSQRMARKAALSAELYADWRASGQRRPEGAGGSRR
jgi:hypothetical protein